jgi:hypothetical protein
MASSSPARANRIVLSLDVGVAQVGVDPARGNGVAAPPFAAQVHRKGAGQSMHAGLGGTVGGMLGVGAQAFDGADVDDAAATALAHLGQQSAGEEHRRTQVDGHHPPVISAFFPVSSMLASSTRYRLGPGHFTQGT